MQIHWLWLALHPGLKDQEKLRLMQIVEDPEQLLTAPEDAIWPEDCEALVRRARMQGSLAEARRVAQQCAALGIGIVTFGDEAYPRRLRAIADPPPVLYYKGKLPRLDDQLAVGIVGTRNATGYGINTARLMGYQIGKCGAAVISGMALGIDTAAMEGALEAGGCVIGVLGCGVDLVYPRSNAQIYRDMGSNCIISEYPPGTPPLRWNFPRRNRIISGLCQAVLVVEAPEKSGSMITARAAADQGRDVYVVPGNVDQPSFLGSYRLLQEGATPASCGWDVVCGYAGSYPGLRECREIPTPKKPKKEAAAGAKPVQVREKSPSVQKKVIDKEPERPYIDLKDKLAQLHPDERAIVQALAGGERAVDDVIAETGMTTGKMLAAMTMLELKGILKRLGNKRIRLN